MSMHDVVREGTNYRCRRCGGLSITDTSFALFSCSVGGEPVGEIESVVWDDVAEGHEPPFPKVGDLWLENGSTMWAWNTQGDWVDLKGNTRGGQLQFAIPSDTHPNVETWRFDSVPTIFTFTDNLPEEVSERLTKSMVKNYAIRVGEIKVTKIPDLANDTVTYRAEAKGRQIPDRFRRKPEESSKTLAMAPKA